jgi:predicted Fe-Mo cluster-binding NifX family protein
MKIAFSTAGDKLESPLDSRFGRAPYFLIYNSEDQKFVSIDNTQNLNAAQGAGIQAAQNVAKTGAQVLITGHTGPKAFKVLKQAKIQIFYSSHATIKEALAAYQDGLLKEADDSDVEGHWI